MIFRYKAENNQLHDQSQATHEIDIPANRFCIALSVFMAHVVLP